MLKKTLALVAAALVLGTALVPDAEAKRIGGGRSAGMQRQQVTQPATPPAATPNAPSQAAPNAGAAAAAAPAAAAATAKRSWMGPIAGLAAGLGLMALASSLGFGEALANIMMIALLAMAALAVVGFIMRKRAASQPAPAWAGAPGARQGASSPLGGLSPLGGTRIGTGVGGIGSNLAAQGTQAGNIPADFDVAAFTRNAKAQFTALQSANDARDLDRLRDYLTPEMFEVVKAEVQSRDDEPQQTEVFGLDAQVLDVAEEADRYIVSVRFRGSVRERNFAQTEDLDEIWHLTKPRTGFGGWVVAGIQQAS